MLVVLACSSEPAQDTDEYGRNEAQGGAVAQAADVPAFPELDLHPVIADVRDAERIGQVFARHRPAVVFHAAAHKHVPMMESNPAEAVKNNILATRSLGEVAGEAGVDALQACASDLDNPDLLRALIRESSTFVLPSVIPFGIFPASAALVSLPSRTMAMTVAGLFRDS